MKKKNNEKSVNNETVKNIFEKRKSTPIELSSQNIRKPKARGTSSQRPFPLDKVKISSEN